MTTPVNESQQRAPSGLVSLLEAIEGSSALDRPADELEGIVDAVLGSARVGAFLRGEWLGHALHPLLTDFPLGAWTATSLLDVFGGRRSRAAATGLLSFGVASALPTVAAGMAEWRGTSGADRRVGVVHAAVNTAALGLYALSLLSRLRRRHSRARALALSGGLVATVGGYFGGHLSLVRKVGTTDPRLTQERAETAPRR